MALSAAALHDRLEALRPDLIRLLHQEASRLGNDEDIESLGRYMKDDRGFELSHYWGYDTRSDAPQALKDVVASYEQIQGMLIEQQAAAELALQEQAKLRRGWFLVGSMAATFVVAILWAYIMPNRFRVDMRKRNLYNLRFVPKLSDANVTPHQQMVANLSPAPGRFFKRPSTFEEFASQPLASTTSSKVTVWLQRSPEGALQKAWLTGTPNRVIRWRLERLLRKALLATSSPKEVLFLSGLVQLPQDGITPILEGLRRLSQESGMVQLFDLPASLQQAAVKALLHHTQSGKKLSFQKLLNAAKATQGMVLAPVHVPGTNKQVELRLSLAPYQEQVPKRWVRWHKEALFGSSGTKDTPRLQTLKRIYHQQAMWDAILRGVQAPPIEAGSAPREWQKELRRSLWLGVFQALLKAQLSPRLLDHPQIIFDVRQQAKDLLVRPMWLLDLKRSELISAKGGTYQWRTRPPAPIQLPVDKGPVAGLFAARFPRLFQESGLRDLLALGQLFSNLERLWRANVPVHQQVKANDAHPKAKPSSPQKKAPKSTSATQHKGLFKAWNGLFREAQEYLATVVAYRRAAAYLLEREVPRAGFFFGWIKQAPMRRPAVHRALIKLRASLGLLTPYSPIRRGSTRIEVAQTLERAAQALLKELKTRLDKEEPPLAPPLRLLQIRLAHEQGRYRDVLSQLFSKEVQLAFYHPYLRFERREGDHKGPLKRWQASLVQKKASQGASPTSGLLIKASSGGPLKPVLAFQGLPTQDAQALVQTLNKGAKTAKEAPQKWLSTQLLMLSVPARVEVQKTFDRLKAKALQERMLVELAFGCSPPNAYSLPRSSPCRHPFFHPPTVLQFGAPISVQGRTAKPLLARPKRPRPIPLPRRKSRRKSLIQIP